MSLDKLIVNTFETTVNLLDVSSELKRAVLTHERTKKMLENIKIQLYKVNVLRATKGQLPLKEITIIDLIKDLTKNFVYNLKRLADERAMSELEKSRLRAEVQKKIDLDKTADGTPSGEYKELFDG